MTIEGQVLQIDKAKLKESLNTDWMWLVREKEMLRIIPQFWTSQIEKSSNKIIAKGRSLTERYWVPLIYYQFEILP